jgi:hypothetical protein
MKDDNDHVTFDLEISILKRNVADLQEQLANANKRIKEMNDALHDAGVYVPDFILVPDTD